MTAHSDNHGHEIKAGSGSKSLADRLTDIISEKGTTERAVAIEANLGPTYVRDITHGKVKSPTYSKLKKVADVLGVSVEYLSFGQGVIPSEDKGEKSVTSSPGEANQRCFTIKGGLVHIEATLDREGVERLRDQLDRILDLMD